MKYRVQYQIWACALLCSLLVGCGKGNLAKVTGTVTRDGQPVTSGGSVMFSPVGEGVDAGKPGSGEIRPDGTYTIGTYDEGDGAVIGKHRVSVSLDQPAQGPHIPSPPVYEFEVKPGTNVFDIDLSRTPAGN
jgi:hypothetical protein